MEACGIIFVIGYFLSGCATPRPQPAETQLTAREGDETVFLYRFSQFVEWPAYAFPDPKSPVIIGVMGNKLFANELGNIVRNERINGRPLIVRRMTRFSDLSRCWILFISHFDKSHLPLIFNELNGGHALTVSDKEGFLEAGGMIQFVLEGDKVGFEVNQVAAERAGLKMSSQMLEMAERPK